MLTLMCGRAGRLWRRAEEEAARCLGERTPLVFLVPEQYTLQAERDLIFNLRLPGLLRAEVLSPSRLQKRVFELAGAKERVALDGRGRRVAVCRALSSAGDKMQYYAGQEDKPGFTAALTGLLQAFKQEGLTPEAVESAALDAKDKVLALKLGDMALVMRSYERILGDRFQDAEQMEEDMLARLPESHLLDGAGVVVYGFDVMTPPLIRLMCALAGCAKSVLVALAADTERAPDGAAFRPVMDSAFRLLKALDAQKIPRKLTYLPPEKLNAAPEIAHIEQYFLTVNPPEYPMETPGLRLFAAAAPYDEAAFVSRCVRAELKRGTPADKVVIFVPSLENYGGLLSSCLSAWGVPHYLSAKRPVLCSPLARYLVSALRAVTGNMRTDDVLEMASSGFSDLTEDEAWRLRNYAAACGVAGAMWTRPFERGGEDEKALMENCRLRLMTPVFALRDRLKQAEASGDAVRAVITFLDETNAAQKLEGIEKRLEDMGLPDEAAYARQIWKKLCDTLEQMHLVLGGERVPLGRFAMWLETALTELTVSGLPPRAGCVTVGEWGRLLPSAPDCAFLMGLNDGCLAGEEDILMSDREKDLAAPTFKTFIGMHAEDKEKVRLLDLWKALSSPRSRLYLSYVLKDEGGAALRPLPRLKALRGMFPRLYEEGGAAQKGEELLPDAPEPALAALARALGAGKPLLPEWENAFNWLRFNDLWGERARAVAEAAGKAPLPDRLPRAQAQKLFPLKNVSVSQLESFARCPFRYFVDYGLRPEPEREWAADARDRGSLYHEALDRFAGQIGGERIPETREEAMAAAEKVFDDIFPRLENTPLGGSPRARADAEQMKAVFLRTADTVARALRHGAFRIVKSEYAFGRPGGAPPTILKLPNGRSLSMTGVIDRVDACVENGKTYVRIVDYKSGGTAFDPAQIGAGLQLQLLIYLQAVLDNFKDALPAGMFYQRVDDPLITTDTVLTAEEAEKECLKALRLNGPALADPDVIRLMDDGMPPVSLPNMLKKDGSLSSSAHVLSVEEFSLLTGYARHLAGQLAGRIMEGDIEARPAQSGGASPCAYCEYQDICRKDHFTGVGAEHPLPKMNLAELVKLARESKE